MLGIGDWVRWKRTAMTTAGTLVEEGTTGMIDDTKHGLRVRIGPVRWRFPNKEDIELAPKTEPRP
jgi:hypothetical protein